MSEKDEKSNYNKKRSCRSWCKLIFWGTVLLVVLIAVLGRNAPPPPKNPTEAALNHMTSTAKEYLGIYHGWGSRLIGNIRLEKNILIADFELSDSDDKDIVKKQAKEDIFTILEITTPDADQQFLTYQFVNIRGHKKQTDKYGNEKDVVPLSLYFKTSELKKVNFKKATPDMVFNLYEPDHSENPFVWSDVGDAVIKWLTK